MKLTKKAYELIWPILVKEIRKLDKRGKKDSEERKALRDALAEIDTIGVY